MTTIGVHRLKNKEAEIKDNKITPLHRYTLRSLTKNHISNYVVDLQNGIKSEEEELNSIIDPTV